MKMRVGGKAMMILKAMPLALSVRLVLFNCLMKAVNTSYNENPLKPGKKVLRLLPIICLPGSDDSKCFFMVERKAIICF